MLHPKLRLWDSIWHWWTEVKFSASMMPKSNKLNFNSSLIVEIWMKKYVWLTVLETPGPPSSCTLFEVVGQRIVQQKCAQTTHLTFTVRLWWLTTKCSESGFQERKRIADSLVVCGSCMFYIAPVNSRSVSPEPLPRRKVDWDSWSSGYESFPLLSP